MLQCGCDPIDPEPSEWLGQGSHLLVAPRWEFTVFPTPGHPIGTFPYTSPSTTFLTSLSRVCQQVTFFPSHTLWLTTLES